jgi:hypothetical protein
MADIRIKDLATTATTTASDDFMAVDGSTNGTRKMNAAAPAFLTSVTTPSLTSPAATNLTLGLGTGGTALTLTSSTLAATFAGNLAVSGTTISTAAGGGGVAQLNFLGTTGNLNAQIQYDQIAPNTGQILFGTNLAGTFATRLTLTSTAATFGGAVTVSSSTAGSAGAGALVVTGGLATGDATYIGGTLTTTSATAGNWNTQIVNTSSTGYGLLVKGGVSGVTNIVAFQDYLGATQLLLSGAGNLTVSGTGTSTFAGAVAIGNTVGVGVAVASTHKVTMVIGGVTYYLLASNV